MSNRQPYFFAVLFGVLAGLFLLGCGYIVVSIAQGKPISISFFGFSTAVRPTGPVVKEDREIESFTNLDISGASFVILWPTEEKRSDFVTIETHSDMMKDMITKVHDGTLSIRLEGNYRSVQKRVVTVHIQDVKQLQKINLTGASRLQYEGEKLELDQPLTLHLTGASRVDLKDVQGTENVHLHCQMTGASQLMLSGHVPQLSLHATGACSFNAKDLNIEKGDINAAGASKVQIGSAKELELNITGASRVKYAGSPTITKQNISGASKVESYQ